MRGEDGGVASDVVVVVVSVEHRHSRRLGRRRGRLLKVRYNRVAPLAAGSVDEEVGGGRSVETVPEVVGQAREDVESGVGGVLGRSVRVQREGIGGTA